VLTTGALTPGARIKVSYYLQDTGGGSIAGTANVSVK